MVVGYHCCAIVRDLSFLSRPLSAYSHATFSCSTHARAIAALSLVCAYFPSIALRGSRSLRTGIRRQTWWMRLRCSGARIIASSSVVISSGSPIAMYSITSGRGGECVNMPANNPCGNGSIWDATVLLSGALAAATTE